MNERLNESLSALMDGEADELEIRRLLNQSEQESGLLDKWANYQMIGAIMRQEPVADIDLAKGVRQVLDGKPMDELAHHPSIAKAKTNGWRWFAASGAVAASVMLAVLVTVQWQQQEVMGVQVAAPLASTTTAEPAVRELVATETATAMAALSAEEQQQLEQAQRKLQEYVLQHSEQSVGSNVQTMSPLMQTVKFNQAEGSR